MRIGYNGGDWHAAARHEPRLIEALVGWKSGAAHRAIGMAKAISHRRTGQRRAMRRRIIVTAD